MDKRKATPAEISAASILPLSIPASAHASDPISWGMQPELYSIDGLKKVAIQKHLRTDEFEKRLMAIWWVMNEAPVPFIFKTFDGTLRSLDAGCVGFLFNRWMPEVEVVEEDSVIVAVVPAGKLLNRYEPLKSSLISSVKSPE